MSSFAVTTTKPTDLDSLFVYQLRAQDCLPGSSGSLIWKGLRSDEDGKYNIPIIATRKDESSRRWKGVERGGKTEEGMMV